MCRNRGISFAALAAAVLLVLGCSSPIQNGGGSTPGGRRYIKLTISVPNTSRSITVTEYQVTGMHLEVLDPHDASLQTIDWDASEGGSSYMIPVRESGEHKLNVTQFGENDGDTVEISESASFDIEAMKITVIEIVPGMVAQILVDGEVVDPLAWIYGSWIQTEVAAPFTDVLTTNPDGTYTSSANYDGSGAGEGWLGSGTCYYDPPYFVAQTPDGPIQVQLTKINNDHFTVQVPSPEGVADMYRKGTQPGGWIFDRTPIELPLTTENTWTEGYGEIQELVLYAFQAPASGDYWVSWKEWGDPFEPSYSANILVSAYQEDEATGFFVEQDGGYSAPRLISLNEEERVYIIVEVMYVPGTFGIRVQNIPAI